MKTQTVLAIGAHIGDAELTAGALLASCAVHGGKAVTLALTAGELMRIPCQMLGKQTHLLNDLFHLADTIRFVFIQMEVVQPLGDDLIHGGPLVQGSGGILEHHLDLLAHIRHLFIIQFCYIFS